ncbi:hypothetical protein KUTeg_022661 [Tegillarca granosa]|uniref:VWFA domain-containing protein n=1 Tax=Tegillarca granosa TaxID=220873 RepID=A0ABQ9E4C8_TEGGR|nr:hypothetical protein KUTeg_022661 [Tegillarca granosa]
MIMESIPNAMPILPPGGLLEIVFSFDTTGSMSSILAEVQGRLQDMIQRLQADIPGIRIGVIAHGDYCDKDVFYLTKQIDLCSDVKELCEFIQGVEGTGGGDQDECYELVLRMVGRDFTWTPNSTKILVMIGDANPHEPDYELNTDNIDWREEVKHLHDVMGIKIYGVQAMENEGADKFYKTLAEQTDGHYIKLGEFSNICDCMMAICYREKGDDLFAGYEVEVRSRFGTSEMHKDLEGLFGALRRTDSLQSTSSRAGTLSAMSSIPLATVAPLHMPAAITPLPLTPATSLKIRQKVKRRKIPRPAHKKINLDSTTASRLRREKVSLQCSGLKWSGWKLAWTNDVPPDRKQWIKMTNGCGFRRKVLFTKKTNKTALYEVSVQTGFRAKRRVVYHAHIKRNNVMHTKDWHTALFTSCKRRLYKQIRGVLNSGCDVFVRRAFIGRRTRQVHNALKKYDYAWNSNTEKRHFETRIYNGVFISGY